MFIPRINCIVTVQQQWNINKVLSDGAIYSRININNNNKIVPSEEQWYEETCDMKMILPGVIYDAFTCVSGWIYNGECNFSIIVGVCGQECELCWKIPFHPITHHNVKMWIPKYEERSCEFEEW